MTSQENIKNNNKKIDNYEKLLEQIKEIFIYEDLKDTKVIEKISAIKSEILQLQKTSEQESYYETMSVTYIDDNGKISEVYRINDEIVTKEAFDDWSYDYFNVIKKQKEIEEAEKVKNEIFELEKKLAEKKTWLAKSNTSLSMKIPDIRESKSSNLNFYNRALNKKSHLMQNNISNSKFFNK